VPLTPGELVEIDIKYVPNLVKNKRYYQFTAIDCALGGLTPNQALNLKVQNVRT